MYSSKYIYFIIGLFLLGACTKDEPSNFQKNNFIKSFGGAFEDEAIDFIKDNDNYYILGNIIDNNNNNSTKIFLVKTDEYGNTVRDDSIPKNNKNSYARQIIKLKKTPGFAIIGAIETDIDSAYHDVYVAILDDDLDVLNDTIINDTTISNSDDFGQCIGELPNGNLIICSNIYANQNLVKGKTIILDNQLNDVILPKYHIGFEIIKLCKRKFNGGFFICGNKIAVNKSEIIRVNPTTYTTEFVSFDKIKRGRINSITDNAAGDTYLCGSEDSDGNGKTEGFIAKWSNPDGINEDTDWKIPFEVSTGKNGEFNHIEIDNENNLLLVGSSQDNSFDDTYNIWALKTDAFGNDLYQYSIGGIYNEKGIKILPLENNSFVLQATTYLGNNSLITLVKSTFE